MYSFQTLEIYNSKSLVSKAVLPKKTKTNKQPPPQTFSTLSIRKETHELLLCIPCALLVHQVYVTGALNQQHC